MVMGNSVKTWDAVYHLAFVEQQAQEAVDGMAQVRAELDGIIGGCCCWFLGAGGLKGGWVYGWEQPAFCFSHH